MFSPLVSCSQCKFWDLAVQSADADSDTTGRCIRHAPSAVDDRTGRAMWPITDQEDRCFEGEIDPDKVEPDEDDPA